MTEGSQKQTTPAMRVAELQRENEKLHEALRIECELNATPVGIIKDRARMEERAAIVAWLREQDHEAFSQWIESEAKKYNNNLAWSASQIENGEHLK